jgi:hypothetical protein
MVHGQPNQKAGDPTWKITKAKWAGGMAQVKSTCLASPSPWVQILEPQKNVECHKTNIFCNTEIWLFRYVNLIGYEKYALDKSEKNPRMIVGIEVVREVGKNWHFEEILL